MAVEWQKQAYPMYGIVPINEQLISLYLTGKVQELPLDTGFGNVVDLKRFHPNEFRGLSDNLEEDKNKWYYFTRRDGKSRNGTWDTSTGYWNPAERDEIMYNHEGDAIGKKKLFDYYEGKHTEGIWVPDWNMAEYRISGTDKMDEWVLLKIYMDKTGQNNDEQEAYDEEDDDDLYLNNFPDEDDDDLLYPNNIIKNIPNKVLKQLRKLVYSYQSLSPEDAGHGPRIVNSIIRTSRQGKLDKVLDLPKEAAKISIEERDLVVGQVYFKIMEIEYGSFPCSCGLHVIGKQHCCKMEAITTLINIASSNGLDHGISPLSAILAHTLGREIKDVYRGSGKGIIPDMELLCHIIGASRCAITSFVERNIYNRKLICELDDNLTEILGFGIDQPQSRHDFDECTLIRFRDLFCELAVCLEIFMSLNKKIVHNPSSKEEI